MEKIMWIRLIILSAASEFKVQGLEIDYGLLAWDADFRYENDQFGYYRFRGDGKL